jgi:hypothetical protein
MTGEEIVGIIRQTIEGEEEAAFEATVDARAADGWASPVLQAQAEWQGHDNGIVLGTFAEALRDLVEYDEMPTGCNEFDPEDWEESGEAAKRAHLVNELSSAREVGAGGPLAYVGVDGYFTLVREGATREQIEGAAIDCLPSDE